MAAGYIVKVYDPNVTAAGIELALAYMKTASEKTRAALQALPQACAWSAKPRRRMRRGDRGPQHAEFRAALEKADPEMAVVDLVRLPEKVRVRSNYQGICW